MVAQLSILFTTTFELSFHRGGIDVYKQFKQTLCHVHLLQHTKDLLSVLGLRLQNALGQTLGNGLINFV